MLIFNGISLVSNLFVLFTVHSWSELAFFDRRGFVHKIHLETCGMVVLLLLKCLANILLMKWGCHAMRTFKPIRKEVESEIANGIQVHAPSEHVDKVEAVKVH